MAYCNLLNFVREFSVEKTFEKFTYLTLIQQRLFILTKYSTFVKILSVPSYLINPMVESIQKFTFEKSTCKSYLT